MSRDFAPSRLLSALVVPLLLSASAVIAQNADAPGPASGTVSTAGKIVAQPARDVGIAKTEIPPPLAKAAEDPYSIESVGDCARLTAEIKRLNGALGPDFTTARERKENRTGKLAEAGGQSIINALIPFRGVVREITGAAPAEQRLNAAIDAGYARRGFLRGLHYTRRCSSNF